MHNDSSTARIPTWQRVTGWIIIACGVYGLLLVVLDVVTGMAHRNDTVKQAVMAVAFLALGTSHLVTPRGRPAILLLNIIALLLFILAFVVPFSPR